MDSGTVGSRWPGTSTLLPCCNLFGDDDVSSLCDWFPDYWFIDPADNHSHIHTERARTSPVPSLLRPSRAHKCILFTRLKGLLGIIVWKRKEPKFPWHCTRKHWKRKKKKKSLFFAALAGTSAGRATEEEKATDMLAKRNEKVRAEWKGGCHINFLTSVQLFALTLTFISLSIHFLFPCVCLIGCRGTWIQY